ncbi:hypothetical protein K933_10769, partial [Candidatus Halobonum tyrrellensis G22]
MVGSVLTAGVAFTGQAAAATQSVSSCTTIDESGTYELTSDVDAGGETCFDIRASDVTLDGNGYTVTGAGGSERAFGVFVNGTEASVSNVTVTDVSVNRWFIGYHVRGASDVTIADTTAVDDRFYGYWVVTSDGVDIEDAVARDHTRSEGEGVSIIRSTDMVLDNVTSVDNDYGIHVDNDARDIRIVDSEISGNNNWGYYMRGYSGSGPANVTATNLTLGDAVVDVVASQNVVLEGADSLPAAPENGQAVSPPLRASTAGGSADSVLNLSAHYDDDGVNESSVELRQYDTDASEWSASPSSVVDADANTVTSPVEFTTNGVIFLSAVGRNATDGGSEPEPEPANFSVSELSAPANATVGDTVTVTANVTNTGGTEATQTVEFGLDTDADGTLDPLGINESVTLAAGASEMVSFDVPTDGLAAGTYTHGVS